MTQIEPARTGLGRLFCSSDAFHRVPELKDTGVTCSQ
jgi:hypothetical protein